MSQDRSPFVAIRQITRTDILAMLGATTKTGHQMAALLPYYLLHGAANLRRSTEAPIIAMIDFNGELPFYDRFMNVMEKTGGNIDAIFVKDRRHRDIEEIRNLVKGIGQFKHEHPEISILGDWIPETLFQGTLLERELGAQLIIKHLDCLLLDTSIHRPWKAGFGHATPGEISNLIRELKEYSPWLGIGICTKDLRDCNTFLKVAKDHPEISFIATRTPPPTAEHHLDVIIKR